MTTLSNTLLANMVRERDTENARLKERLAVLEGLLGFTLALPSKFRLTLQERSVFLMLMQHEVMSKTEVMKTLYPGNVVKPDSKIIDVLKWRIQRKVQPFGIEIETRKNHGYRLSPQMKEKVLAIAAGEGA